MRFRSRARSFSITSRVSSVPLASRRLLVFSSCRSAWSFLAFEQSRQTLGALVVEDALLVVEVAVRACSSCVLRIDLERSSSSAPLREKTLHVDDRAFDARRAVQRSVFHVAGLFAEDRAQQLLFRRELRLALRRDLADQDVARLHRGADADDAALVEVAQERFADVRDVARDFFRTRAWCRALRFRTPRCGSRCSSPPSPASRRPGSRLRSCSRATA